MDTVHGAAGLKQFPVEADIGPTLPVPVEVRTGEDAVLPITLLPYRDVRDNFLSLDQPAEELARPIGRDRLPPGGLGERADHLSESRMKP